MLYSSDLQDNTSPTTRWQAGTTPCHGQATDHSYGADRNHALPRPGDGSLVWCRQEPRLATARRRITRMVQTGITPCHGQATVHSYGADRNHALPRPGDGSLVWCRQEPRLATARRRITRMVQAGTTPCHGQATDHSYGADRNHALPRPGDGSLVWCRQEPRLATARRRITRMVQAGTTPCHGQATVHSYGAGRNHALPRPGDGSLVWCRTSEPSRKLAWYGRISHQDSLAKIVLQDAVERPMKSWLDNIKD